MKPEHAKVLLNSDWFKAYAEGKTIQYCYEGLAQWRDVIDGSTILNPRNIHRIKPTEPSLRPWKPEEVPVGALLRHRTQKFGVAPVTTLLSVRGAWIGFICAIEFKLTEVLTTHINENYEHSLDYGKTWLPCGVME